MNAADKIRRDVLKILLDKVEVFEHDLDLLNLSYREKYKPYVEMLKTIKQQTSKQVIMENKQPQDIPQEFRALLCDFRSCQLPMVHDGMTEKSLREVAINIYNGKYSLQDFYDFAAKSLGNGYFSDGCKEYVTKLLEEYK